MSFSRSSSRRTEMSMSMSVVLASRPFRVCRVLRVLRVVLVRRPVELDLDQGLRHLGEVEDAFCSADVEPYPPVVDRGDPAGELLTRAQRDLHQPPSVA